MNARQTNILNMSHAVGQALDGIIATNPLPVLGAKIEAFKAKVAEIQTQAALQALPTTGKAVNRDRVFAVAIDATLVVADLVRGYARTQKLGDLEARVQVTPSVFRNARIAHRVLLMQQVYDAALAALPQLDTVGVTAERLAALRAKIDAADAVKVESRSAIVARGVATEGLQGLFWELRELLKNELDPQMNALRETDPKAWATYRAARKVIDQPGKAEKTEAVATTTTATVATEKLAA